MTRRFQYFTRPATAATFLCAAFFIATSFRHGWNRDATDFRNYYTGAVSVREGQRLRNFYDANWFQGQINKAGVQALGSYIPQTPLATLPLLPLSWLPIQTAKRIWLLFNLGFLFVTFWMISRLTGFSLQVTALVAFIGYGTLHTNFLFGQYYVCLLFLVTASLFCLERNAQSSAGVLLSTAFALKLYGGPFLLYLAVKRRWAAAIATSAATLLFIALTLELFGWSDLLYFVRNVLPRALAGEVIDPYNSLNNTFSTLLRRLFVSEPELNPHPLWNAPAAFFFLKPFLTWLILFTPAVGIARSVKRTDLKRTFAWFALAVMLASPNIGSYTYVLAFLPVMLLLENASPAQRIFLVICYFLLGLPMNSNWSWYFPKLWIVLVLFVFAGRSYWRLGPPSLVIGVILSAASLAVISAVFHSASYSQEPEQFFEPVAVQKKVIFSSSPAVLDSGIAYEALSRDRYVLRWFHNGRTEEFRFNGHVINPVAQSPDGPIRFDLLANRRATRMLFDVNTSSLISASDAHATASLAPSERRVESPDKRWIVFSKLRNGNTQIWLGRNDGGNAHRITGGNCSSSDPAWELDSSGIVFASDCNRGMACPALYRAQLPEMLTAASSILSQDR